jgi:alpha(1,3/1,4) fucosyltransferase
VSSCRVKFVDDYASCSDNTCYLYSQLRRHFDLEVVDDPDFLFYSVFGHEHSNPRYDRCVRIWHAGENIRPDFARCDYALSSDHIEGEPRHLRLPEYVRNLGGLERSRLLVKPPSFDAEAVLGTKTRFCNFLYANGSAKTRMRFFSELSKYKQVDSGGSVLNNIGRMVPRGHADKLAFLQSYKFTIAFENARYPGYVTEKLVDPMLANSIPIYWGNWQVEREFNTRSFVCCHEYESFNDVIEEIVRLDQDGGRYVAKMREPWLVDNILNEYMRSDYLVPFFERVFATPAYSYPRWSGVVARDYGFRAAGHGPEYQPPAHMVGPPEYRVFE